MKEVIVDDEGQRPLFACFSFSSVTHPSISHGHVSDGAALDTLEVFFR